MTDTNYIVCQVDVIKTGTYVIYSDTLDGIYFHDNGSFTTVGFKEIIVRAFGRKSDSSGQIFLLRLNSSKCSFAIPPPSKAVYSFSNCESTKVFGNYKAGQSLTTNDSVSMQVNVTAPGQYQMLTNKINGISFTASGNFAKTGLQFVHLKGIGTPAARGNFDFLVAAGNTNCGFVIGTGYKNVDTSMYFRFQVGNSQFGGYLDSAIGGSFLSAIGLINTLSIGSTIVQQTDTVFNLVFSRIKAPMTIGQYHSAVVSDEDFAGGITLATNNKLMYNSSKYYPAFIINLVQYAESGKLVSGEFSGPVEDSLGNIVQITNGTFKTYLSQQ